LLKIVAAICFVLVLSSVVRAELVIFCELPAPDRRECCPIVLDLIPQVSAEPALA